MKEEKKQGIVLIIGGTLIYSVVLSNLIIGSICTGNLAHLARYENAVLMAVGIFNIAIGIKCLKNN